MTKGHVKARRRPSLQSIYVHHIIWGGICLILLTILMSLWFNSQALNQKTAALEQRVSLMGQPACVARNTWQADTTKQFEIQSGLTSRAFYVHLPKDFDPNRYYPLVTFFPGKGSSAKGGEQATDFNSLPAIIAYPEPTIGKDGAHSWEGAPYSSGSDDVSFVGAMLDTIQGQLCIERSHIYAAGMSNGGGMVSLLSCKLPDRFAAFGIVAGAMYYPDGGCVPPQPTALINIHGEDDGAVPYLGSPTRKLPQVDGWVARRAHNNGCSAIPTSTYTSATSVSTIWQSCTNGATVQNIRLLNTGHIWLPSAPVTLWQFFRAHSL
jgi:polyhydroxybutyrate depolymerase